MLSSDVKCSDVKVMFVPQFESLSVELMFQKAREWEKVWEYLPEERDLHRLPRNWVVSLLYTIVGAPFEEWVS